MKKIGFVLFAFVFCSGVLKAQNSEELGLGLRVQKTEQLYWENGLALDYTSDFLLKKQVHLKMSYVTSGLGSAMIGNAVLQDNLILGADWRFRAKKDLQIFTGLNVGYFNAKMDNSTFDVLPHSSLLFSAEAGLFYKFKFPLATSLSVGYNIINGDGVSKPGTLFPVYYQLSVFYYISKK